MGCISNNIVMPRMRLSHTISKPCGATRAKATVTMQWACCFIGAENLQKPRPTFARQFNG